MEPTEIAVARAAYNAYNAGGDPATANKNFRGEPCPEWDDLPQNIRDKWIAAMKPSTETLDGACRWRDDALGEWRKSYPCPRGCGTMGQCIDPATMSPAICPVCYNETPVVSAPSSMRISDAAPGDVLRDKDGDLWLRLPDHDAVNIWEVRKSGPCWPNVGFDECACDCEAVDEHFGPFTRLIPEPPHAK